MCMYNALKYNHIAFYFSRNYGCTLDTELNRLSFSSYFDKSHLELWRKKQVLIQGAPNLSHCLKSWKKYLTKGVIQYHFLHLSAELNQSFFLAKVSDDSCQTDEICDRNSLSFLSTGFIFNMNRLSGTRLLTPGMRTVLFKCTRKSHTWNSTKAITSYYRALHESMG